MVFPFPASSKLQEEAVVNQGRVFFLIVLLLEGEVVNTYFHECISLHYVKTLFYLSFLENKSPNKRELMGTLQRGPVILYDTLNIQGPLNLFPMHSFIIQMFQLLVHSPNQQG